jgi:hypothetical protein
LGAGVCSRSGEIKKPAPGFQRAESSSANPQQPLLPKRRPITNNPFALLARTEDKSGNLARVSRNIEEKSMKQASIYLVALTFAMSLTVFAQDASTSQNNNMSQTQADQMSPKAPLMTLKGTVKADGDKYTFVDDKDGKTWDVMNPEALKGHEGHHVQLSAHVYADKDAIHVMSVKMLKKNAGSMN